MVSITVPHASRSLPALRGYSEQQIILALDFLNAVVAERERAHAKHGATSMEQAPPLDPWRGLILGEEALECGKALNDHRHGEIWLAEGVTAATDPAQDPLDKELIQTAAMAYTWWTNRRGDRLPRIIDTVKLHEVSVVADPPNPHTKFETGGPT